MKPMPISAMHCATSAGFSMMLAPSASSTSALPDLDDTERPPCLATRAPAAAATNIDAVEMLKVCDASPPVPTMSTSASRSGTWPWVANSRITCAAAAISPMVSFLTRKPTVSAAIITGDASPLMILRISASISSWKISRCSIVRCSASCNSSGMVAPLRCFQKIVEKRVAFFGQDRFRVKLDAADRVRAMAHTHDLAVVAFGGDLEAFGQACPLDDQRVVARRGQWALEPFEQSLAAMRHRRELAVHDTAGANDASPERLADRLV